MSPNASCDAYGTSKAPAVAKASLATGVGGNATANGTLATTSGGESPPKQTKTLGAASLAGVSWGVLGGAVVFALAL